MTIDNSRLPYLLVEVANVHGGDEIYLRRLVARYGQFAYARKGIKFQVFKANCIALPDFSWFSVYKRLYFNNETWRSLIQEASALGDVWIDVFDTYSTSVIRENLKDIAGLKLQASVLGNLEVLRELQSLPLTDKKIIINISGFELNSIYEMVETFQDISHDLILQMGYQAYPTAVEHTSLQKIGVLKAAFPDLPLCMADHADGSAEFAGRVPVYANLLGCEYIEKHLCLERASAEYDSYSALEPQQMEQLCKALGHVVEASSGSFICDPEKRYLEDSIQIPVLRAAVDCGSLLSPADFIYRRTAQSGISARDIGQLQRRRMILSSSKLQNETITPTDFKEARISVIVAGRMKSTRLPRKAILPIAGVPSIERCLMQCVGIQGVDQVVLATSDLEEDAILQEHLLGGSVDFWRGQPDDVIGRYLGACNHFGIDVVVRVTADCPLVMPDIIEFLLEKHFEAGADYTAADKCAVGSAGEIINVSALRKVADYFGKAEYSEYMTWYFRNNFDHFKINIVSLPDEYVRNYRLTLDYPDDLVMFESLYSRMPAKEQAYRAKEVYSVLDDNRDIAELNSHHSQGYVADKELIKILNNKTKMQPICGRDLI